MKIVKNISSVTIRQNQNNLPKISFVIKKRIKCWKSPLFTPRVLSQNGLVEGSWLWGSHFVDNLHPELVLLFGRQVLALKSAGLSEWNLSNGAPTSLETEILSLDNVVQEWRATVVLGWFPVHNARCLEDIGNVDVKWRSWHICRYGIWN